MLNRYIIAKDLKFIFDNINDLNNEKIYTYMLENKGYKEPDDIHKSIENLYYEILLNENWTHSSVSINPEVCFNPPTSEFNPSI